MYNIITAIPMHLSRFFQLKPIVRWVSRLAKNCIPYIPYRSLLLLSTIVLNDNDAIVFYCKLRSESSDQALIIELLRVLS